MDRKVRRKEYQMRTITVRRDGELRQVFSVSVDLTTTPPFIELDWTSPEYLTVVRCDESVVWALNEPIEALVDVGGGHVVRQMVRFVRESGDNLVLECSTSPDQESVGKIPEHMGAWSW